MTHSPTPAVESFALRLRTETMTVHREAESEPFIVNLMEGRLTTQAYIALLEQYSLIYPALEAKARELRTDPIIRLFHSDLLERTDAIEQDLAVLAGAHRAPAVPTPATAAMVRRLHGEIAPERYLAHHYLRYLGDLSGGLAIGRLVARHYGIGPEALNMWSFPGIEKPKLFKDEYRHHLDTAPLTAAQRDALIAEAADAYQLSRAIFAELGESHVPATASA